MLIKRVDSLQRLKKVGGGRCVLVSVAVLIQKIEGYGSCVGVCEMCTRKGNSEITRKPAV